MSKDKPTDGRVRINGMTLQEYKQSQVQQETAQSAPHRAAKLNEPQLATPEAHRLYDPPWSYLDPDNAEWEQFRKSHISLTVNPAPNDVSAVVAIPSATGDLVGTLVQFFAANGKQKQFAGFQRSLWADAARKAGIQLSENAFDLAWRIARAQKLVIPRGAGAPKKVEQVKRRPGRTHQKKG